MGEFYGRLPHELMELDMDEWDEAFEVFRMFKEAEAAYLEQQRLEMEARRSMR
jgi:hypothetical protein